MQESLETLGRVVVGAGIIVECKRTDGGILGAGCVEGEGTSAVGRVVAGCGVVIERSRTGGGILLAGGVRKERSITVGGIVAGGGVVIESTLPGSGIFGASAVGEESLETVGRVVGGGVVEKRFKAGGRVGDAGCVGIERSITNSRIVVSLVAKERLVPRWPCCSSQWCY